MNLCRVVVAVEYLADSESGVPEWAEIRHALRFCRVGVKVIEPPSVVQEIARHEPEKEGL